MTFEEYEKISEKEGDYHKFRHNYLNCVCERHSSLLHWCGYVHIPKNHPAFSENINVNVHGGITWDVNKEKYREIGFDCAHLGDLSPYFLILNIGYIDGNVYRDLDFVINQCKNISNQLNEQYPQYGQRICKAFLKMNL